MPSQASVLHKLFVRSCDSAHHGLYRSHVFAYTYHITLRHLPFRCLPSLSLSSRMEEQQNMRQPHGTTWWNHSYYTGIPLSALHSLRQLQPGASSWSPVQILASTQEPNGTASSSFMSSLQLTHTAIRPQIQAGSTRIVASDVMSATLAEAATQLSFAEFLERCNLYRASPPHPQPNTTLLLDAAAQTPSHSVASADATTQQPLTEFFLGCIYSKDPLDRSAPPPTHGNASSASLPQPTDIVTICSSQLHQPHQ